MDLIGLTLYVFVVYTVVEILARAKGNKLAQAIWIAVLIGITYFFIVRGLVNG